MCSDLSFRVHAGVQDTGIAQVLTVGTRVGHWTSAHVPARSVQTGATVLAHACLAVTGTWSVVCGVKCCALGGEGAKFFSG